MAFLWHPQEPCAFTNICASSGVSGLRSVKEDVFDPLRICSRLRTMIAFGDCGAVEPQFFEGRNVGTYPLPALH